MFSLNGKTIVVIGAGSGIGEAIAIGAADQGASYVACLDVNETGAGATAARIDPTGVTAGALTIDIADAEGTRDCLEQLAAVVRSTASCARRQSTSANRFLPTPATSSTASSG